MSNNKEEFNPFESFIKAEETQGGLPPVKDDIPDNSSKEEYVSTSDNKIEKDKSEKKSPTNEEKPEFEPVGGDNNSDFENDKKSAVSGGKTGKLKKASAKVMVSQGDRLQSGLAVAIWDVRSEKGLGLAKKDYNHLHKKVVEKGSLSEKERALFDYCKKYIEDVEKSRERFESTVSMTNDEKQEIIDYMEAYMEDTGWEPSPMVMILGLVLITIGSNIYTAIKSHKTYNPPI